MTLLEDRAVPAVITVTSLADVAVGTSHSGVTLRDAIQAANTDTSVNGSTAGTSGANTIQFASNLAGVTINLSVTGDTSTGPSALDVTSNITILGPATGSGITIAGEGSSTDLRLFLVGSSGNLTLQDLTLSNGSIQGGSSYGGGGAAGMGGAVFVEQGTLNVLDSTLIGNVAQGGNSGVSGLGLGGGGLDSSATDTTNGYGGGPNGGAGVYGTGVAGGFGGGGGAGLYYPLTFDIGGFGGFGGGAGGGIEEGIGGFGGGYGDGGGGLSGGFGGGSGGSIGIGGGGAGMGGAIFSNGGTVVITNSTLANNSAIGGTGAQSGESLGGAVFNRDGTLTITASTLSANVAATDGRQVFALGDSNHIGGDPVTSNTATTTIIDSILAQSDTNVNDFDSTTNFINGGTSNTSGYNDIFGALAGYNGSFISSNPKLGPLGNYGGTTETFDLLGGSPALNAGTTVSGLTTDQRGVTRQSTPDIGSYEGRTPTLTVSASGGTYNGNTFSATETIAGSIAGVDTTPSTSLNGVTPTFDYYDNSTSTDLGATAPKNAGSYTVTATFAGSTTYVPTSVSTNFVITQAPLTVAASAKSKAVGASDPALTYAITSGSLVNGDSLSGSLTRDTGTTVGSYEIRRGTLTASANYNLAFTDSLLYITAVSAPASSSQTVTVSSSTGSATATTATSSSDTSPQISAVGSSFDGELTATKFGTSPVSASDPTTSSYFDLHASGSNLASGRVTLTIAHQLPNTAVLWWNGSAWKPVRNANGTPLVTDSSGSATFIASLTSTPPITKLTGTYLQTGSSNVPATVTTGSASAITGTSATLNAAVNANGSTATTSFQYSTTANFVPTVQTTVGSGFNSPFGVAVDAAGDVFVADFGNSAVKEVEPNGTIPTTIGSGFSYPIGVAVDAAGDVFVVDGSDTVKEVEPNGIIVTIGSGFSNPKGVAVDAAGDVFIADAGNQAVKEVEPNGTIDTISSGFSNPFGVAVDAAGDVFVADYGAHEVDEVEPNGTSLTIGSGFFHPTGVAVDAAGDVFVADSRNNAVKEVEPNGTILTIGSGFSNPTGVAVDASGDVFVADYGNNRVEELSPASLSATPSSLSGSTTTSVSASLTGLTQGTTYYDRAIASGPGGTVVGATSSFIAIPPPTVSTPTDTNITTTTATLGGNVTSASGGTITARGILFAPTSVNANPTLGGTGVTEILDPADTTGTFADAVSGLSLSTNYSFVAFATNSSGTTYTSVSTFQTLALPTVSTGSASSITGTSATLNATVNANGSTATTSFQYSTTANFFPTVQSTIGSGFSDPEAVAVDAAGDVFVADYGNSAVNEIEPNGTTVTISSAFSTPRSVAVDAAGDVFVANFNNSAVKEVEPNGTIVPIGSGFSDPTGVAVDAAGDVFVADFGNSAVKEVEPNGTILTIGSGFSNPKGVAVDAAGDVFVADTGNNAVKEVEPNSTILTIGSGFSSPYGVAVDAAGDVFVADTYNNAVKEVEPNNSTILTIGSGFSHPYGVAVDGSGDVFVADYGNKQVEEISPASLSATPSSVSGSTTTSISAALTGLTQGTTYYDRAVASGPVGTVFGATSSFTAVAPPTISTPTDTNITTTSATLGGNVTSAGGGTITTRGILYAPTSVNAHPTLGGSGVTEVNDSADTTGTFADAVSGLSPLTGYSFVAFATNAAGTTYTSVSTFQTLEAVPTITSPTDTAITSTSATLGGNVTSAGGGTITKRGVLYAPTSADSNPALGDGIATEFDDGAATTGTFADAVSGLSPLTGYSFVAFATNAAGTTYTSVSTFQTLEAVPTITTPTATNISPTAASLGGNVTTNGGGTITARGILIAPTSVNANPTLGGSGVTEILDPADTTGVFTDAALGLSPLTGYSYVAFATNAAGTTYTPVSTFQTLTLPTVSTGSASAITGTSATLNATVNANGSTATTSFQYSTTANFVPTVQTTIGSGFYNPFGVAVDAAGDVFVVDNTNNAVKEVEPNGTIRTIASGFTDPYGVAVDAAGDVFVADTFNDAVKEVEPNGTILTIGSRFTTPTGVAVDAAGDVFVVDYGNNAVKEVEPNGTIRTIASGFLNPRGVAVDAAGDVFVADTGNNAVKEVEPNGTILTIGSGFSFPYGVAVDAAGDVFVADYGNNAVKEVEPNSTILTIGSGFSEPTYMAVDAAGDVFVADTGNSQVEEISPASLSATPSSVSGSASTAISASLTGLTQGTTYYDRAVASGPGGTVIGATSSFISIAPPTVSTPTDTNITTTTATLGGNVTSAGGGTITKRGVLYAPTSADSNPTLGDGIAIEVDDPAATTGTFADAVSGLSPLVNYSFVAFATDVAGTTYTPVSTFQTLEAVPTITSPTDTAITSTTATLGGNVTSAGGGTITKRGVLYAPTSVNASPTLGGSGVIEVNDASNTTGTFADPVSGLSIYTNYSFVAFATNAAGTTYTTVSTFQTLETVPTVSTPTVTGITWTTATLGGNATGSGGALNKRGVLYALSSVNANPTLGGSGVTEVDDASTATGVFTEPLTGLSALSSYSFVAFDTNAAGTAYTPVSTFQTLATPTVTTGTAVPVSTTSETLSGTVNANGSTVTGKYQYSTTASFVPSVQTTVASGFNHPNGVAVDAAGDVFVADPITNAVTEIKTNGTTATIGSGFDNPWGVAVDAAGDVFVADYYNSAVKEVKPNGTIVTIGSRFSNPTGVAVDAAGDVYVSSLGSSSIEEIKPNGTTATIGSGFSGPEAVAVDAAGDVFVADTNHNAIKEVKTDGTIVTIGPSFASPWGVAVDAAGDVFAVEGLVNGSVVFEVEPGSSTALTVGSGYAVPSQDAVDAAGDVFVADYDNNRIVEVAPPSVPTTPSSLSGTTATPVSATATGLSTATTYDYRLVVTGAGGTVVGATNTFTTVTLPTITTPTDTAITPNSATLGGNVTSNGNGPITGRGILIAPTSVNASPTLGGNGVTEVLDSAQTTGTFADAVSGLSPLTNYSFVAFVTNAAGTRYTAVSTFETTEAPSLVVTTTSDTSTPYDNLTSLREAIVYADSLPGNQTITFAPSAFGTPPQPITLNGSQLEISKSNGTLTIDGPGANLLTISGNNASRVFQIDAGATVEIDGATITGGSTTGSGGGILNQGFLTLNGDAISNNHAGTGGGIDTTTVANGSASLIVLNSTVNANSASYVGGIASAVGAANATLSTTITNSTITGNSATSSAVDSGILIQTSGAGTTDSLTLIDSTVTSNTAGGIFLQAGVGTTIPFLAQGSIIALNGNADITNSGATVNPASDDNLVGDGSGGLPTSAANNNLLGSGSGKLNPLLAALGSYGGTTQTMPPLPGSPVIGLIPANTTGTPTTDERGFTRVSAQATDAGAAQDQGYTVSVSGGGSQSTLNGTVFSSPLTVSVTANDGVDPVNGGTITFTAPGSGASATLTPSPATIANGSASVTATANGVVGLYTINAATPGSNAVPFAMINEGQPVFTSLGSSIIVYGTSNVTLTGNLAAGINPATGNLTVTISGNGITPLTQSASLDAGGNFTTVFNTASLPANPTSPYTVTYAYTAQGYFLAASDSSTSLTVNRANATVVVTPYTVTYDGTPHTATVASIIGVNGETGATVGGVTLSTTHTSAGSYSDNWTFTGASNYNNIAATTINDTINKANATVLVTPYTVTYDGTPHTATVASITGVNGETGATVGGVTLNTTHTNAGSYSDNWTFTGASNYNSIAATTINDTINKANATVLVTPYTVTYDGTPHTATVASITGVNGETGATVGGVTLSTTHTSAGSYSDNWTFTGASNYNNIAATTINDTINKANATVVVTPYTVTYDGTPHTATVASITGVNGETGATVGGVTLNTTHTNAGSYSDNWTFTGASNYNNIAATTINDTINKANATVLVTPYTVTYDGTPHTATVASITGVNGETGATVGGVTLSTTHTSAGSYSDNWTFTGASNYNNIAATTINDTINKANTTIAGTPSAAIITLGTTQPTLGDTATLSGAYNESGTVTFTLENPGGAIVDTETAPVSANGMATTPKGYTLPNSGTIPASYVWNVSYGGDGNNNGASDLLDPREVVIVNRATPTVTGTPTSTAITLATTPQTLKDTANLAGGYYEGGSIVFTLLSPGGATVDTETVAATGNGSYTTPTGYTPPSTGTVTGNYQWNLSYTGDGNDNAMSDIGDKKNVVTVSPAGPTVVGTPSATSLTLGTTAPTLKDTAALSGGYYETGTITFTLDNPGGAIVDTETASVHGNGAYTTPTGYTLPTSGTVPSSYVWNVSYSGDGNNNGASDNFDSKDVVTIAKASPTLTLSAATTNATLGATTVVIGSGTGFTATATLAAGYFESGSISFMLYGPSGTLVNTQTVAVNGNQTYTTPTAYQPTTAGAYQWVASYSGDGNNNAVSTTKGNVPEVAVASGVSVVGNVFYVIGGNTGDYAQISPVGSSGTGSTGLAISATLNNTYISKSYSQPFTAIVFYGFSGNDNLQLASTLTLPTTVDVGNGNNYILLAGGNDTVIMGTGSDQVFGGNGNKTITASDAAGTSGYISLGVGNETISLGNGNDQVVMGGGTNVVTAGNGNDAVTAGNGTNTITLGNGNNYIHTATGTDTIALGSGNEDVQLGDGNKTVTAQGGNNYVSAGTGSDVVVMGSGNDNVQLGGGSNTITLGNGGDFVSAGSGNNTITVGNGADNTQVGNGNNVIVEGSGLDFVSAGNGSNLIVGGTGQHDIQVGNGNNILIDGSAQLTQAGDTLRAVLDEFMAEGSASAGNIRSRLLITYNNSHINTMLAGSGLDWFFATETGDVLNAKKTDLRN